MKNQTFISTNCNKNSLKIYTFLQSLGEKVNSLKKNQKCDFELKILFESF